MPVTKPALLIVLDTNVLVSGLLKRSGPPGRILELIFSGAIQLALDIRILDEYTRVLGRPALKIPFSAARHVLDFLAVAAEWVTAEPLQPIPPHILDPADLPFAEVAITARAWGLVTGNQRHFTFLKDYGLPVLAPADFLASLPSQ
jgi:putative PIN family toxin of toxin-antitoxin system